MTDRQTIFYDIPPEWRENAKKGLCPVCGKHKAEFQKLMRVYCSPEHRDEYNARIFTWASFRDRILQERGKKCENCGIDETTEVKNRIDAKKKALREWAQKNQEVIELERARLFDQAEEAYRKAFDEEYIINRSCPDEMQIRSWHESPKYELDHKLAIVNGGEMFDVNNVQVLCGECHKKKTTEDVREHKRKMKKQEVLVTAKNVQVV
jgi:5-methylcytosine-specific restriction endonuclease McrA